MNHECYWIKTCCRIKISMKLALANTTTTTTQRRYICMIISKSSSFLFLFFLFLFHFLGPFCGRSRPTSPTTPAEMIWFAVVCASQTTCNQRTIIGECYYCYLFRCRLSSMFPELSTNSMRIESQHPFSGKRFCLFAKDQIGGFPTCKQFSVPVSKQEQILVILERSIRN